MSRTQVHSPSSPWSSTVCDSCKEVVSCYSDVYQWKLIHLLNVVSSCHFNMIKLFIFVSSVMFVNSESTPPPDSEVWETKCHKTQVEQYIFDWNKNGSLIHLPRLRTLRTKYPGEKFHPIRDSACDDHKLDCKLLADRGQCTGSDFEVKVNDRMSSIHHR